MIKLFPHHKSRIPLRRKSVHLDEPSPVTRFPVARQFVAGDRVLINTGEKQPKRGIIVRDLDHPTNAYAPAYYVCHESGRIDIRFEINLTKDG